MVKSLFLLCPTDCLETIINKTFKHENYFYASLGNSFNADTETLEKIKELVKKHNIGKIYIVLSNDNQIISGVLKGQFFSGVRGLKKVYREVAAQKNHSEVLGQANNHSFSVLSYYLNKKIKELQFKLSSSLETPVQISGKVYFRQEGVFKHIYSDLICIERHYLN